MTKYLLIGLGIILLLTGLLAPYESHSLWAFFLSTGYGSAILRELLGFSMVIYGSIPALRTPTTQKLFGGMALILLIVIGLGVATSHILLLDILLYSLAAIFSLLASVDLGVQTDNKIFTLPLKSTPKTKSTPVRHVLAH